MIDITLNGITKQLKNELIDISIADFERVCVILNKSDSVFERYINIFQCLGLTVEDIDGISEDDFLFLVDGFIRTRWEATEFVKELTIDGKIYTAFTGDKFVLSIRDLAKIEKYVKFNQEKYLGELLAIIYKDLTLPKEQWYDEKYISEKAELFRNNITANIVLPYTNLILSNLITKLQDGFKTA